MDSLQIIQSTSRFLDDIGLTLPELFKIVGNHNSSLLDLDDASHLQYSQLLEFAKKNPGTAQERGKLFEDLISCLLFSGTNQLFDILRNCKTTTNEIDMLVGWSACSRSAGLCSSFDYLGDSFLCECKNYNKAAVGVTYVGKFFSLLKVTQCTLGIMFSRKGLTGKGQWDAARGLVKKIALSERVYIISFDLSDMQMIADKKENFFSLLDKKYTALKSDVNFEKYISPHEFEEALIKRNE